MNNETMKNEQRRSGRSGLNHLIGLIRQIQGDTVGRLGQTIQTSETTEIIQTTQTTQTFLIVGLGNPGRENVGNRHNIGFILVDCLAARLGLSFSRLQNKALATDGRYERHKLILAKPQTYMNETGRAVAPLVRFYKIPIQNLLVAFDDMDLPLGTIRIRPKGGSSGHKGMKSIIQQLGNQKDFPRLRLGIGRPPGRMDPAAYLLQDFSTREKETLEPRLDSAVDAVVSFVTEGLDKTMNQYNGSATNEQ